MSNGVVILGPFVIVKRFSTAVYRIKHEHKRKTLVVHFNRLKPCLTPADPTEIPPLFEPPLEENEPVPEMEVPDHIEPDKITELEDQEYEIEKIIRGQYRKGKPWYLVHWKGFPASARTWEPYDHLSEFTKRWVVDHPVTMLGKPSPRVTNLT